MGLLVAYTPKKTVLVTDSNPISVSLPGFYQIANMRALIGYFGIVTHPERLRQWRKGNRSIDRPIEDVSEANYLFVCRGNQAMIRVRRAWAITRQGQVPQRNRDGGASLAAMASGALKLLSVHASTVRSHSCGVNLYGPKSQV